MFPPPVLSSGPNITHLTEPLEDPKRVRRGQSCVADTQLLKLECLVCESAGEACIESRFVLPRRAKRVAEIQARLIDLCAEVVDGQVMVSGILHKQIFFVGEDHHVHHVSEDVPFTVFVDCPGAVIGQDASVTGRICKLTHGLEFGQELCQRAILQFVVRVTEDVQVCVVLSATGPLVKAECVVGETTKAVIVENCVELDKAAIKVRDIQVALEDITAEAGDDQVLFQGTLHKSIFYVSEEDVELFQEERIPFSGIADICGVEPSDNVTVKAQILRVDRVLSNGRQVRQRVTVSLFIKVTRTCELNVAEDANGPEVMAPRVISTNSRQVLVENVADLNRPAQKVQEIQARVEDLGVEVIPNKVVITGTLHKQIFYVSDDNIVRHMGEDIPFTTFVDLPGVNPGDAINITPIVEHVGFELIDEIGDKDCDDDHHSFDSCDPYVDEVECPLFRRLIQRTVIQLVVTASQDQPIRIATAALPATAVLPTSVTC